MVQIRVPEQETFLSSPDDIGGRLDVFVAKLTSSLSRSRVRALIENGDITVDGRRVRPAYQLKGNEEVSLVIPAPTPTELKAEDIPLTILFEDDDVIVINKPAGLVVHPGAGHPDGTLVNALLFHVPGLSVGGQERPGIVHRLDKDTSGVILCAKNEVSHRVLSDAFRERQIGKRYLAFTIGVPRQEQFDLVTGHVRDERDRRRYSTKLPAPQPGDTHVRRAHSAFNVRAASGGIAAIEVELHTGRTHQIRAHLADVGHPILQDELYGGLLQKRARGLPQGPVLDAACRLKRHALHAAQLRFPHPKTGEPITVEAPLPPDLETVASALGVPQLCCSSQSLVVAAS